MIRHVFIALVGGALLAASGTTRAAEPLTVEPAGQPVEWTISYRGQPVMVYASAPQKFKPYIKALYTLKGYNVLRDSPFDHLHHHALMYGIRVNGVNFWEETAGCGVQKVIQTLPPELGKTDAGLPQARIAQVLQWVAPEDAFLPSTNTPALLLERRTLVLTLNEARQEVAVQWKSQFQVGTKTNTVVLSGANYHGLGMRFLQELDGLASHFTPEGKPDLGGSKQDVSPHKWEAVSFDAPGKPATLVLLGHPSNARGDAQYFSMRTPFAYISAIQGLDKEPLVYRAGDTFELNYLVTLYPSLKSADAINERAREWNSSKP
jgi:hypothetical protein